MRAERRCIRIEGSCIIIHIVGNKSINASRGFWELERCSVCEMRMVTGDGVRNGEGGLQQSMELVADCRVQ